MQRGPPGADQVELADQPLNKHDSPQGRVVTGQFLEARRSIQNWPVGDPIRGKVITGLSLLRSRSYGYVTNIMCESISQPTRPLSSKSVGSFLHIRYVLLECLNRSGTREVSVWVDDDDTMQPS